MSRPQDWLPRTVYSLVDSSSQVRLKALYVLRACHSLTLTSPQYGPKLAKTLVHVFRKPLDDNGAMLISMFEYAFQDFFNPVGAEAAAGMWGTMLLLLGPAFHSWEYRAKWLDIAERSVFVRKPGNPTAQTALLRVWRNLVYMSADRPLSSTDDSSAKDLMMLVAPLRHLVSTSSAPMVLSEAVDNWMRVVYSCLNPACVYSSKEELGLVWTRVIDNCVCTMLLANDQRTRILAVVKQLLFSRPSAQTGSHTPNNLILASPSKSGAHHYSHSGGAPMRWFAARILDGETFDINDIPSFPSKWTRANYDLIRVTLLDTILPQCINNNGTETFVEIWKLFLSFLLSPSPSNGPSEFGGADEMLVLAMNDSLTVLEQLKGGSDYGLLMHLVNILEPAFSKLVGLPSEDSLILTVDSSLRIVRLANKTNQESEPTENPYQIGPLTLFWSVLLKQQQAVSAVGRPDIKLLKTYGPLSMDMLHEMSTVLTKIAFNNEFKLMPLWMKLYSIVFDSADPAVCEDMITINNLVRLHTCINFVIDSKEPWEDFMTDSFSDFERGNRNTSTVPTSQHESSYKVMASWLRCLEKMNSLFRNSALLEEYCRDVLKSAPHAEVFFNHLCYTVLTQQPKISEVTDAASTSRSRSSKKQTPPEIPNNYSALFQSGPFEKLITLILAASDMLPETVTLGYKLLKLLYFKRDHFDCLLDGQYALLLRIAHLELGVDSQWYAFWREFLGCFEAFGLSSRSQLFKTRGKRKSRTTASVKYCYEWSLRVIDFFVALYGDGTTGLSGLVKQALSCFVERHTRLSVPEKLLSIVDDEKITLEDDSEFTFKHAYKRTGSSKGAEVTYFVSNAQQISSSSESEHEHEKHVTAVANEEPVQADMMIIDEEDIPVLRIKAEQSEQHLGDSQDGYNSAVKHRLESAVDVDLTQDEDQVVDMEIDSSVPDLVHTPKKQTATGQTGNTASVDVFPATLSSSAPTSSDDEYEYNKPHTLCTTNISSKTGIKTAIHIVEPEEADTVMTEEDLSMNSTATDKPVSTDDAKVNIMVNDTVVIVEADAFDESATKTSRDSQRRSKRKAAREAAVAFSNTNDKKRKHSSSESSSIEPTEIPRKSKRAKSVYKNKPEVTSLLTALEQYTNEIKSNWPAINAASTATTGACVEDPMCVEDEQRLELSIKDKQRAFELETRLLEALSHTRKLLISDSYK